MTVACGVHLFMPYYEAINGGAFHSVLGRPKGITLEAARFLLYDRMYFGFRRVGTHNNYMAWHSMGSNESNSDRSYYEE